MAKMRLSSGSEAATLLDLLPSLSDKEVEEMHQSKIKLASDKSAKTTRQMKDLERDINILATEIKLRKIKILLRTSELESIEETCKTTINAKKKKKQGVKMAPAKKATVPSRSTFRKPKYHSDSSDEDVASNINSDAKPSSSKSAESIPLEDDNKKVSFSEKKTRLDKQQPIQKEKNSSLEQVMNKFYILEGKELDYEQVDYQLIKEKDDALLQEYMDQVRLKLEQKGQNKSVNQDQTGGVAEQENIYALTVAFAEPSIDEESLGRPPSVDPSNSGIDYSLAETSTNIETQEIAPISDTHRPRRKLVKVLDDQSPETDEGKKPAKNAKDKKIEGLVQDRGVRKKRLESELSKPEVD